MKIIHTLFCLIIGTLSGASVLHSQVIIQHSGLNDPLTEGFFMITPGEAELAEVIDDQGYNAWSIHDTSRVDPTIYLYQLLPEQSLAVNTYSWVLSATMRLVEPGAARLEFTTGSETFLFSLRLDEGGDIMLTQQQVPLYTLEGGGAGYHDFSLVYDAIDERASFWVDGVVRVTNIVGSSTIPLQPVVSFGNSGSESHTHWNDFTLAIVPEPATVALLTGLGALLVAGGVRWRKRKIP